MTEEQAHWLKRLRDQREPLPELMHEILRAAEKALPLSNYLPGHMTPDWPALHALDFAGEVETLTRWMDDLLTTAPPPDDINGLYFCVTLPGPNADFDTAVIHTHGSRSYGQKHGWALDFDWFDDKCNGPSVLLNTIWRAFNASGQDIDTLNRAHWTCFQFIGLLVAEWTCGSLRRKFLGSAPSRFLFVGLDVWMGFNIATLTPANTP